MTVERSDAAPPQAGDAPTQLDVLLEPDELRSGLEADARAGLTSQPKSLPPKYFYDDRGSALFEQITRLPEYYQTRTERAILEQYAPQIAAASGADVLLELGSGSSAKTRWLLDALQDAGHLGSYVPVDVSAGALRDAMGGLREDYPDLHLHGVVADFDRHLGDLPAPGRRLIAFLGGTIGNYPPARRRAFLSGLAAGMRPGESFLVGVDLVKDPDRIVAAYDDSSGVTAQFNRNVIRVLDRELGGDLDPDAFEHIARWNPHQEWIELHLRAHDDLRGRLAAIDLPVEFAAGEEMLTEISAKFTHSRIDDDLSAAGLQLRHWWTDEAGDFALALAVR